MVSVLAGLGVCDGGGMAFSQKANGQDAVEGRMTLVSTSEKFDVVGYRAVLVQAFACLSRGTR